MRCSTCDKTVEIYKTYFSQWQRLFFAFELLEKEGNITIETRDFLIDILCNIKKPIEDADEKENLCVSL